MTTKVTNAISNDSNKSPKINIQASLIHKFGIDVEKVPILSCDGYHLDLDDKRLILEKLLEAHQLAAANVMAGNITNRGFATNVCDNNNFWSLGTNFNNTRNDISSICGERAAILTAYNNALINYSKNLNPNKIFNFKIKYLCMAQSTPLNEIKSSAVPCEDCLSWLNTNRYFDDNTVVFSFEKDVDGNLSIRATKLIKLLPYRQTYTSCGYRIDKKIIFSKKAINSLNTFYLLESDIKDLIDINYKLYKENEYTTISKQNIVCSIISNSEIFSSKKIDWTRRWHVEPLEFCASKAVEKYGSETKISVIAYFGDEFAINSERMFHDGVVSVKSLGRIRQKYANSDTILILNLQDEIFVVTVGEYLPEKFIQGYKI